MADIDILVNSSQVKTAKQELQELGNSFNSASKSASIFMQAFERAAKQSQRDEQYIRQTSQALQRLIADNLKITNAYKSAEQSASAFTEELRKQEAQAQKTAQANQAAINKQLGVGGPSATSSGAGFGALDAEVERLRNKYDQIYASSQLYERSLKELGQAHMLGVMNTKQHEAAVESLNAEYQAFQSGITQAGNRFTQHVNQTSTGMNKFGVAAQQTGYQVSDFIVQVQGGTNPLVAFSQQATQLAGLLYLLPNSVQAATIPFGAFSVSMATATAGVTILIPLLSMLAMSFFSSSKESEKVTQAIDKQKEAYDNLVQVIVRLREERAMLESGAATSEEQAILTQINQLELQRAGLLAESAEIAARINEEGATSLGNESIRIAAALEANAAKRAELETLLRIAEEERKKLSAAEAQRQAHADQVKYMGQTRAESDRFVQSLIRAYGLMAQTKTAATQMAAQVRSAASAWLSMGQVGGVSSGGGTSYLANQYALYGQGRVAGEQAARESGSLYTPFPVPEEGGGGGGRAEARLKKQIDLTKELTQVERERQTVIRSVESSLEDGFMAMVEGTESVKDAFKKMAYEIIKELYRVLVVQRLVGGISGGIGMLTGPSTGSFGLPFGRASGGSIMPGQSYLVGEHGPELVIPRHSGTVVNANQTANAGGGSGTTVVNNNISVTGSDAAMVRAEVAKMIPQITNATKAAVIDARLRGGQMRAAFS